MARDYDPSGLSRRDFLKALGLGAGAMFLAGCAPDLPAPPSLPGIAPSPTLTPFQPSYPTATPRPTEIPSATPTPWTWSLPTRSPAPSPTTDAGKYSGRKLCFVLWDHQLAEYGYRPRNPDVPLPETVPLRSGTANRLTAEWEAYWKGILRVCNPGMSDERFNASWLSLVADARAFTNNKGPETDRFSLWSITCGGATHEMVDGEPEGWEGRWTRIYTLNHSKGPPPIPDRPDEIDITRHFMATTGSNNRLPDGSFAVYGFPQFENPIVPLLSPGDTDLIETSRIKPVDKIQRPYNT